MSNIYFDSGKIKEIFKQTLSAIDLSKKQIFDIAENIRNEYNSLKNEFDELQSRLMLLMSEVTMFEKQVQDGRQRLYDVNKNYDKYSEETIERIYDKVNNLVISLAEKREEEKNLILHRNSVEQRLKTYTSIINDTDKIITQISVAMNFLEGNLSTVTKSIDELKDKSFLGIQIIEALESERERIARDIHDGPAQSFANISLSVELIKKLIEVDKDKAIAELDAMKQNAKENLTDMRKIIYDLKPFDISETGLVESIHFLADSNANNTKLTINVKELSKVTSKDNLINMTVFRIVRECLNNAKKYANATIIDIILEQSDNFLNVTVADNGVGFDIKNISPDTEHGFGIASLKRQCKYLQATFDIKSEIGKGTKISIRIPIED